MAERKSEFPKRLKQRHDELRWLYMELYDNGSMFAELCSQMEEFYHERKKSLKSLDRKREADPSWYRRNGMLGMMLYTELFAGTLDGVRRKLDYIEECGVNCLHLMPFLDTPKGESDGGYAVSDFRKVRSDLGTMADLCSLSEECHRRGINLCMDFVMNHTSRQHEWARKAAEGDGEYMSRYFFFDSPEIPEAYERTVPQVFPTTAPGNFTWLPEAGQYVLTTFYPYQWDLNYRNPRVFNEMMYNFLYLANQGMDIIRIDAVPYIWKELGTSCRNLAKVHTIVRLMRLISEIVCPGVLLLGEVVMEPQKVAPYFGTVEKPECHMLYNVTAMAATWHTAATKDTRLLRMQTDQVAGLPKSCTFLNYLRCHDDIGWGLDYGVLRQWGMEEIPHKKFLNQYFLGQFEGSVSRGELYNDDPVTMDARFCGTTASMCGVEKAGFEGDEAAMTQAIRLDIMLHACMLFQSGIPMLYSGDEIGAVNDYSYKNDPEKAGDSRYLHRGKFHWELAEKRKEPGSVQERIFSALRELVRLRRTEPAFDADAYVRTQDTGDQSLLVVYRQKGTSRIAGVFNFACSPRQVSLSGAESYVNLLNGMTADGGCAEVEAQGFLWLKAEESEAEKRSVIKS